MRLSRDVLATSTDPELVATSLRLVVAGGGGWVAWECDYCHAQMMSIVGKSGLRPDGRVDIRCSRCRREECRPRAMTEDESRYARDPRSISIYAQSIWDRMRYVQGIRALKRGDRRAGIVRRASRLPTREEGAEA